MMPQPTHTPHHNASTDLARDNFDHTAVAARCVILPQHLSRRLPRLPCPLTATAPLRHSPVSFLLLLLLPRQAELSFEVSDLRFEPHALRFGVHERRVGVGDDFLRMLLRTLFA